MISGYTSIKNISARLYAELGISTEISESNVAEWCADALSMIGSFYQYDILNAELEMDEGKTRLPLNYYKLIDIRYNNRPLMWSSNALVRDYDCEDCKIPQFCSNCDMNSFYINNSFLITDIKETSPENKLCISYLGVPVDEDGYPLIPDDIYFFKACVAYITHRLDYIEWRKANISDKVFNKSESEWLFYVNSARGSANAPNLAQIEGWKNIMVRLIPKQNSYLNSFKNINNSERRKRFN